MSFFGAGMANRLLSRTLFFCIKFQINISAVNFLGASIFIAANIQWNKFSPVAWLLMTSLTLLEQLQKQAKSIPLTYKYMAAHLKSGWVRLVLWAQTFYLVKRCCQASAFRMSTLTRNRRTALFHWILAAMKIDAPRKFTAEMFIWNFIQKNNVLDNNLGERPCICMLVV
jgi:hypothetical protein